MNLQEPEMTRLSSFSTHTRIAFTNCAQKVLEEFGGGQPMNYREITAKALAKGWRGTKGKTPENSMYVPNDKT